MRKGELTRQQVIGHALVMASERGLEAISLRDVAAESKLTKSALYTHFDSKETLQLAVLQEARERYTTAVVRPALAAPRGEPRMRALFANELSWIDGYARQQGCPFMSFAHEFDARPGPVRDEVASAQVDMRRLIERVLQGGIDEGHFRSPTKLDTPQQFSFEYTGLCGAYQQSRHLLESSLSRQHAQVAFEALLARWRVA
jgi:AcrR family transcriptional regulator